MIFDCYVKVSDFFDACDFTIIWLEYDELPDYEFFRFRLLFLSRRTTFMWPVEVGFARESWFFTLGTVGDCLIELPGAGFASCSFWTGPAGVLAFEFDLEASDWLYFMEYFSSPVEEFIVFRFTIGVKGSLVAGVSWNPTEFSVNSRSLACSPDMVFLSSTVASMLV